MIKKVIVNILMLCLSFVFFPFKRKSNIWMFSGFADKYADSAKYLFEHLCSFDRNVTPVWITSNTEVYTQLKKRNLIVVKRKSLKGIIYCFRSRVFIYSSYPSDINTVASLGAVKVNLWHGYPFKIIERDISIGPLAWIYDKKSKLNWFLSCLLHPEKKITPDLMFATDSVERERLASAFGCSDVKLHTSLRSLEAIKNNVLNNVSRKTRILYAPTWRSTNVDQYYKFLNDTIIMLNQYIIDLDESCTLELRLHPIADVNRLEHEDLQNVVISNTEDINDKTLNFDLLITDFSSVLKNFQDLDLPYILYANDLEDYLFSERGIYADDISFFKERMVSDPTELCYLIEKVLKSKSVDNENGLLSFPSEYNRIDDIVTMIKDKANK